MVIVDEVIVAYVNSYAADNILAEGPANLGACELIAASGMAGKVLYSLPC